MVEAEKPKLIPHNDTVSAVAGILEALARAAADKRAIKQAQAKRVLDKLVARNAPNVQAEAQKATQVSEALRNSDMAIHKRAETQVKSTAYQKKDFATANAMREDAVSLSGNNVAWMPEIKHSPAAAEFAAIVTALPEAIRANPQIMYKQAAQLYWSVDWVHASKAEVHEARQVLETVFTQIRQDPDFANMSDDTLMSGFDRRFDLYRTKRLADPPRSGPEPDEDKEPDKHAEWKEKRIQEEQNAALDRTLLVAQTELDREVNQDPKKQRRLLGDLERELRNGNSRGKEVRGLGYITYFNPAETDSYLEQVGEQTNKIEPSVRMQDATLRAKEDQIKLLEQGGAFIWKNEYAEKFGNHRHKEGDIVLLSNRYGSSFSKEEVAAALLGKDEQMKWVTKFRRENSNRIEPYHLELPEMQKLYDYKEMVKTIWGDNTNFPRFLEEYIGSFREMDELMQAIKKRPPGRKAEQFSEYIRYLTPEKLEMLRQIDYVEVATPIYVEAIGYVLDQDMHLKDAALQYLLAEVDNPFVPGQRITRNDLEKLYRKKYATQSPTKPHGDLTQAQFLEMEALAKKVDLVGNGVLQRDHHMLPRNIGIYEKLVKLQESYIAKQGEVRAAGGAQGDPEQLAKLKGELDQLGSQFHEIWESKDLNSGFTLGYISRISPDDTHSLKALRDLSPVEMVVWERMRDTLRSGEYNMTDEQIRDIQWKINEGISGAQGVVLGTGIAMEVAAKRAQSSSMELIYLLHREASPTHFMERSFAEPWTRVLNHQLFADDFHMGGLVGDHFRDILYTNSFRVAGFEYKDVMRDKIPGGGEISPAWKDRRSLLIKNKAPQWVLIAEYAQHVLGLSYSEVVRPDTLYTGLMHANTTWRDTHILLQTIRDDLLRNASTDENVVLNNEALGMQFHTAPKDQKIPLAEKMLRRKISTFVDLMGRDLSVALQGSGLDINSQEWKIFKRALSVMELRLWHNDGFLQREVDLGDFNQLRVLLPDALRAIGVEATEARMTQYHNAITGVQRHMDGIAANGKRRIVNWAENKFLGGNLHLGMSDFNLKKMNYMAINGFSFGRRINDFIGQSDAADIEREIAYGHPELYLYPKPGKELDAIMKIHELRAKIIDYSGVDGAEVAAAVWMESVHDWNFNLASETLAGWVPGLVTLLKAMPDIHEGTVEPLGETRAVHAIRNGTLWLMEHLPGGKEFVKEHHLRETHEAQWPRKLAALVSPDAQWSGMEGNGWDQFKVAGHFADASAIKMFTTHQGKELFRRLKQKYHTGWLWRVGGTGRKSWWAVLVATVALGLLIATEEEKKKSGSSH